MTEENVSTPDAAPAEPKGGVDLVKEVFQDLGVEGGTDAAVAQMTDLNTVGIKPETAEPGVTDAVDITGDEQNEHEHRDNDDQISDEHEELVDAEEIAADAGKYKITNGGDDIFLDDDATIGVKVDGELQQIPIKDFQSALSAQADISRRYSALDQERKALEGEFSKLNQVNAVADQLLAEGKALEAVDFYLTERGINPQEFMMQFFDQIAQPLEQYMSLPDAEKQLWQAQVRAETNRLQYESLQQQQSFAAEKEATMGQVQQIQQQFGMTDEQFVGAYDQLMQEVNAGTIRVEKVDAALVGRYHQLLQDEALASSVLPEGASNKEYSEMLEDIRHLRRKGHEVTADLLKEQVLGQKVEKSKQVQQALAKKQAKTQTTRAKAQKKNPLATTGTFLDGILNGMEGTKEDRAKYLSNKKKQYRLD